MVNRLDKNNYRYFGNLLSSFARIAILILSGGMALEIDKTKFMNLHRVYAISIFLLSIFFDIQVWMSNLHSFGKFIWWAIAGLTTLMAFANAAISFKKNFGHLSIVNKIFIFITPKKSRHRGINISKTKNKD